MPYSPKGVFAPLPLAQRGVPMIINGDPKGQNILYCLGNSVIIRDIDNPGIADIYTQHSTQASVARYAPSGYYIASGDASGKVRIWDTTQKEHILKYEYQPISGRIKDIVWSPDSKRIAICGEGREKYGHVFLWDSGSSVGDITGHSKFINSIDYRPVRPFRVVTASEDKHINQYEGPPFRFKLSMSDHTGFVNIIRYSGDGEYYCSGGADGRSFLYNGKTGEKIASLGGDKAHAGGIYCLSWGPDSKQVLTASGDKTCKLWDVETQQVVTEFKMGTQIEDQQVSCLWQGAHMLSVSVSGFINYLDVNSPDKPRLVLKGQNKNMTSLAVSADASTLYGGSYDGRISHWSVSGDEVDLVGGPQHTNQVSVITRTPDAGALRTVGLDKTVRTIQTSTNKLSADTVTIPDLDPTGLAVTSDETTVVTTLTEVVIIQGDQKVGSLAPGYTPRTVGAHPSQPEVAIGGEDNTVYVYTVSGASLTEKTKFKVQGEISAIAYSPDGASLAVTSARSILVFDTASYQQKHDFLFHAARVMCIAWSPNSQLIASGSIDTNIIVWSTVDGSRASIKGAHPLSIISGLTWISDTMFASTGFDSSIRTWEYSA